MNFQSNRMRDESRTHRMAQARHYLARHENRDSMLKTSPRSSVDQTEPQNPSEKQQICEHGGHVVDMEHPVKDIARVGVDSELSELIDAWPKLPHPIQMRIMAMVKAAL